jgi:uncharacterized membrane protein YoaK (UPF0700 family)
MNPTRTRKLVRLAGKRTLRMLRGQVMPAGLQHELGRTLDRTLDLLPLDAKLLLEPHGERGKRLNRQLAWSLAFVAGAINAGGFLAVKTYTSHVTGAVSRMADEFALGDPTIALGALGIVLSFMLGAFTAGLLISLGRRRRFRSHYALSLMIEAGLLLVFGFTGSQLNQRVEFYLPVTVILLSYIMGMHNAVVTTISSAEVRTTHMTGIVTDIGTELSRLVYRNRSVRKGVDPVLANRDRLKLHGLILVAFFAGGLAGAIGFKHVGFKMTIIYAVFLFVLAWRPIVRDLRARWRLQRQGPH